MNVQEFTQDVLTRAQAGHWFMHRSYLLCPHRQNTTMCSTCAQSTEIMTLFASIENEVQRLANQGQEDSGFTSCSSCGLTARRRMRTTAPNRSPGRICPQCHITVRLSSCPNCNAAILPVALLPTGYEHLAICHHCNRRCSTCGRIHAENSCHLDRLRSIGILDAPITAILARPCNLDLATHVKKGEKPLHISQVNMPHSRTALVTILPEGFPPDTLPALQTLAERVQLVLQAAGETILVVVAATAKIHAAGADYAITGPSWGRLTRLIGGTIGRYRYLIAGGLTSPSEDLAWVYVPLPTTDCTPAELLQNTIFAAFCEPTSRRLIYPVEGIVEPPDELRGRWIVPGASAGGRRVRAAALDAFPSFGPIPPLPDMRVERVETEEEQISREDREEQAEITRLDAEDARRMVEEHHPTNRPANRADRPTLSPEEFMRLYSLAQPPPPVQERPTTNPTRHGRRPPNRRRPPPPRIP